MELNIKTKKLVNWMPCNKLILNGLCYNINSYNLLKKFYNDITKSDWYVICRECKTKEGFEFIENFLYKLDYICYIILCKNIYAIDLIKKYRDIFKWDSYLHELTTNPMAIEIIDNELNNDNNRLETLNKIWFNILMNPNGDILVDRYLCNIDITIDYNELSKLCESENTNALKIVSENIDLLTELDWLTLCGNKNPYAMQIIEDNLDIVIDYHKYISVDLDMSFMNGHIDIILSNINVFSLLSREYNRLYEAVGNELKFVEDLCKNPNPLIFHSFIFNKFSYISIQHLLSHSDNVILNIIAKNIHNIDIDDWLILLKNKNAINIIKEHQKELPEILRNLCNINEMDLSELLEIEDSYIIDMIMTHCFDMIDMDDSDNRYILSKNPVIFREIDISDIIISCINE